MASTYGHLLVLPFLSACAGDDDDEGRHNPMRENDDGVSASPTPDSRALAATIDRLLADVCAGQEECTKEAAQDCSADAQATLVALGTVCPEVVIGFLECAADSPTCEHEVRCASESKALQRCRTGTDDAGPMVSSGTVDDATIRLACEVFSACDPEYAASCLQQVEATASVFQESCPGVFSAYLECVATMTGCDPSVECPDQLASVEGCGLVSPTETP